MTNPQGNPGWAVQLAVHRAVRRDVGRLSAALAEGRKTPPAAIRAYWAEMAEQLHHHHVFEDTSVWPLMGDRLGRRVDALLARNAQEHLDMAAAMEEFGAAVAGLRGDTAPARAALGRLEASVEYHLAHEEAEVLPLIPEAFTLDDIAAFQVEAGKTNPPRALLPWVLDDATEADYALFTAAMPAPVRSELESKWLPERQEKVDALRAE